MVEKAIFRVDKPSGEVFALFPEIPVNHLGKLCRSTRGPADVKVAIHESREAKAEEYKLLAEKLTDEGYDLRLVKRATPAMQKVRMASAYIEEPHSTGRGKAPNEPK